MPLNTGILPWINEQLKVSSSDSQTTENNRLKSALILQCLLSVVLTSKEKNYKVNSQ